MTDNDRFRLLSGPYTTPVFQYGDDAFCERRGDIILCGLTDARIPWPVILCGDLVRAVRCESASAVKHWWGVSTSVVRG